MTIDFKLSESIATQTQMTQMVAEQMMRPISRQYDESEHDIAWDYINAMWPLVRQNPMFGTLDKPEDPNKPKKPKTGNMRMVHTIEALSWGDAGIYLTTPGGALGGAAVAAAGTPEQKERFLSRFVNDEKPVWGSMAMTEPQAGSDTSAIRTTAVRDGNEWILNGEKIYCTGGRLSLEESNGIVVVWATLDPKMGRAAMKAFVVEAGTPGMKVTKLEHKMGIRASDTAAVVFTDCRIPLENVLGSPDLPKPDAATGGDAPKGFKGAMKTFDATRPAVAASAVGIARAALELLREKLIEGGVEIRDNVTVHEMSALERDYLELEAQYKAAWLLTLKAAWMMDQGEPNTVEASACKVKAGEAVTVITQRAVEMLGPLGYSRELLMEKWMRDAKINDIFEGTGQINRLIIARRILGFSSRELK
ncbi:MAG: acyl-CoA dehydrogenase family protein [Herpetosiphon sp.]|nr:acyl-CoA dehydrogenase family protein [Herpetosiphon sp.]